MVCTWLVSVGAAPLQVWPLLEVAVSVPQHTACHLSEHEMIHVCGSSFGQYVLLSKCLFDLEKFWHSHSSLHCPRRPNPKPNPQARQRFMTVWAYYSLGLFYSCCSILSQLVMTYNCEIFMSDSMTLSPLCVEVMYMMFIHQHEQLRHGNPRLQRKNTYSLIDLQVVAESCCCKVKLLWLLTDCCSCL